MADIGLVPGYSPFTTRAIRNTERLTAALLSGKNIPISFPRGTTDFYGTSITNTQVGCGRFESESCRGYPVQGHPTLTGNLARIVQRQDNTPWLRIRGNGFYTQDPIEIVGPGDLTVPAIEIEGRSSISTGGHYFGNITFSHWDQAIKCLAGYYNDSAEFVSDESHADNSHVIRCGFFALNSAFKSLNQQALNWSFERCYAQSLEGTPAEFIWFDIVRGGMIWGSKNVISNPNTVIFQVTDYSQNNANLVFDEFTMDLFNFASSLTLFRYAGALPPGGDLGFYKWRVRTSGYVPPDNEHFDDTVWLDIQDDVLSVPISRNDIQWDVRLFDSYVEA